MHLHNALPDELFWILSVWYDTEMRSLSLLALTLFMAGCSIHGPATSYQLITDQLNYREYSFSLDESSNDTSSTVAQLIQTQPTAFSYDAREVIINDAPKQIEAAHPDTDDVITTNGQTYALKSVDQATDLYAVYVNDIKLFERKMCLPASLADPERYIYTVNEKLVVQFYECEQAKISGDYTAGPYTANIYYDGQFLNEAYQVKNAEFVFVWNNQVGFIAQEGDESYVWFDGKKVSSGFDYIHIKNCCAYLEWTPRLYDNGTFVIYGQRHSDGASVIAEMQLE